jgi:dipeptidyl aminopeptidase/acylaminoacyl peptidase
MRRYFSSCGWCKAAVLFLAVLLCVAPGQAQDGYKKPSPEIVEVLNAPELPALRLSPNRETALLVQTLRYPPVADLAQPMLRLAGLRINPKSNGAHRAPRIVGLTLKRIADGRETRVTLPPNPHLSTPAWSPDGRRFAFTHATPTGIQLWIGDAQTGATRQIPGVVVNAAYGSPIDWMPDSRTLLCRTVPAGRGKPPERPAVPAGPNVQENAGRAAPVPTFQDLLEDGHGEDLFDYYATSQMVLVDVVDAKATPLGKPAIFGASEPAPDGQHILVARVHRPYSYQVPVERFPRDVEVWNHGGRVVYKVANLPLAENVPLGGVPTGPRSIHWVPTDPATLVWVEALDEGNPRKTVPHRDRVVWTKAPFQSQPAELVRTEHRYARISWGEKGDLAYLREFDRRTQRIRMWLLNPQAPAEKPRQLGEWNSQDRYRLPGDPMMRPAKSGLPAMMQHGDFIYLAGPGGTPEGDRPFLDRLDTKTLKAERLFRCDDQSYEIVEEILSDDASKVITRREGVSEPPNYFVGALGSDSKTALTNFTDPSPQLRKIKKELVTYKRGDGVQLSFTLYLPPDYKPGERRPAIVWAYPREFTDPDLAGQVSGSPNRFLTITGPSHLFFALAGYVVLDGATMPVVGDPETVNNTYVEQVVASARAAVDKAAEMGVIDPERVGVGGHSYGAFMTANLLAHSDVFRAGIARSGAYNRTLTPFGFQSERRTLWEATEMYVRVSPFLYANRINEPVLLIHGEADNNTGTFPIQSERMYHALKGHGATVRYVTLPHESHGYAGRESVEHTLWEMLNWFDTHVKNAAPVRQRAATRD